MEIGCGEIHDVCVMSLSHIGLHCVSRIAPTTIISHMASIQIGSSTEPYESTSDSYIRC